MCFFSSPSSPTIAPAKGVTPVATGEIGANLGNLSALGQRQLKLPGQVRLPSLSGGAGVSLGVGSIK